LNAQIFITIKVKTSIYLVKSVQLIKFNKGITMPKSTKKVYMGPVEFSPYRAKKGEAYMNSAQKAHFRKILLAWKTTLMEEVELAKQNMQHESETYADLVDSATQETNVNLEIKKRDRERKLLRKIDKSLEQLDHDDSVTVSMPEYGYCEDCGAEIGLKRLEARPTATLCIDCKTLQEIKEKQE
jgi:DnaK suppressor protein